MQLTADFHTHTPYSHGKNTVFENAQRAKEMGLSAVAITEHGFSHVFFGIRRRQVDSLIAECKAAEEQLNIPVLVGIESNIRSIAGGVDLTEADYEKFDIFLAGIHDVIKYEHLSDCKIGWGNLLRWRFGMKEKPSLVKASTEAYINAVKNHPIDVLTHLNFRVRSDAVEVAKCCRDYGTYLELSGKKAHLSDEELDRVVQTGVRFVVNSDAHSVDRIGDVARAFEQIERVGVPLDRIDNIDGRMPSFRFAEFKKHM